MGVESRSGRHLSSRCLYSAVDHKQGKYRSRWLENDGVGVVPAFVALPLQRNLPILQCSSMDLVDVLAMLQFRKGCCFASAVVDFRFELGHLGRIHTPHHALYNWNI